MVEHVSSEVSNGIRCEGLNLVEVDRHENQSQRNDLPQNGDRNTSSPTVVENQKEPQVGMFFYSIDEAKEYYQEYGRQEGFTIRIRSSQKTQSRVDEVTNVLFVCSREGTHKKEHNVNHKGKARSCSTIKKACLASMRILYMKEIKKWKVSVYEKGHNHNFVTPIKRHHLASNRNMPTAAKDLTERFDRENMRVSKVPWIFGGDQFGYGDRDCWNHLRTTREIRKRLGEGDAQSVINYFQKKYRENHQYFYDVQVNKKGRATNFFWVDPRSRMAYEQFGDFVTFDTTYRTNKFKMSFAPFTGVNHHYQSIQFGCALLHDETEATFYWLFKIWVEAMGGRHPTSIITDQDAAMCGAVKKVFPNTKHRLCIWHNKKKFGEKLGHVYFENSKFKNGLEKCIHFTYKVEDFERIWKSLMEEFKLTKNPWLEGLFDIRECWALVYHRRTFFAGMNTTGRSEGVNAFFNEFLNYRTSMGDFVNRYVEALKRIVRNECDEDFVSEHKDRIVSEHNLLLTHAASVYTRNMFDKFRIQLELVDKLKASEPIWDGVCDTYMVTSVLAISGHQYVVKWNKEKETVSCKCGHFEFTGILCRHVLKIFVHHDVDKIPSPYILKRWTKGANLFRGIDEQALHGVHGCSKAFRLSHLCRRSTQMWCVASEDEKLYKMALVGIEGLFLNILNERDEIAKIAKNVETSSAQNHQEGLVFKGSQQMPILDPVISETKGRPKGGTRKEKANSNERWKPAIEIASNKKKRKCVLCKSTEHDRRRCPKNPKLQANLSMPSPTDETTENLGHDHTDILNNNEKM